MNSILAVLAAFLFVVGLALVSWILVSVLANIRRRGVTTHRQGKAIWRVVIPVSGILLIALSQFLFWMNSSLKAYSTSESVLPLGTISFHESSQSGRIMTVASRSISSDKMMPVEVLMRSDAAVLEVETIRFAAPFGVLGLTEYCRISTIKMIDSRNRSPELVYERKIQPESESVWEVLDEIGRFFPIVETSKSLSEPVFFEDGTEIQVFSEEYRIFLADNQ
jgi:hypothetical protein